MPLLKITLGSAATPLWSAGQTAGPQTSPTFQQLIIFNKGANNMYLADDSSVTSTTGLPISPSGSVNLGGFIEYSQKSLADFYLAGTAADVAVVLYIQ